MAIRIDVIFTNDEERIQALSIASAIPNVLPVGLTIPVKPEVYCVNGNI